MEDRMINHFKFKINKMIYGNKWIDNRKKKGRKNWTKMKRKNKILPF